ncbi:hypothetical protein BD560DRAFT_326221 [Blakeslea trispora]|nr:hypothetical protein BD560DRAFT_326221 [Blakeslea trispora]
MRQADIIVSRDNPQHLHHHSRSNSRNSNLHDLTVEQALSPGHRYSTHTILKKDDALLYEKKKSVVILLGRLLLKCGCPCHRVDSILQHTAKVLVLDASFAFLPDSVLITFTESDNSQSIMVKAPQGYDNGKIIKINETMNLFFQDKIDLDRCLVLLHDIATAPPTCGIFGTLLFFAASSFSASVMLFKGTWIDGAISGSLGLLVAMLYLFSIYYPTYALVFEMSTSIIVALIAKALHQYCCFVSVAMSSLLILLPGYTMTVGVVRRVFICIFFFLSLLNQT